MRPYLVVLSELSFIRNPGKYIDWAECPKSLYALDKVNMHWRWFLRRLRQLEGGSALFDNNLYWDTSWKITSLVDQAPHCSNDNLCFHCFGSENLCVSLPSALTVGVSPSTFSEKESVNNLDNPISIKTKFITHKLIPKKSVICGEWIFCEFGQTDSSYFPSIISSNRGMKITPANGLNA